MLSTRLAIGIPMVVGFLAILWIDTRYLAPWYPLWVLSMLVVLGLAAVEIAALLSATSARPSGNTVFGGVLAIVLANWAPHVVQQMIGLDRYYPSAAIDVMAWPLWAFVAVVMFTFVAQSAQFERPGGTMATISSTVLAVAYIGVLGSFLVQIRWLEGPYRGLVPLAALMATAKGADVGAYTLGRIAGRHKLWPRLSPNKTIEGALGGLILGVAGALMVFAIARYGLGIPTIGWPAAVGFGVLVSSAAQLGDLMESMIKRDCAAKDASQTLPGFGGVLDVLDSLLFAGPVAYGYWLIVGP
ncbi:phosphatidate cytidylyltransferase [soil metagenome]